MSDLRFLWRFSACVLFFTHGLLAQDGGKEHVLDWGSPPELPYEIQCGDTLKFEWDTPEPKGFWKLYDEWCPSSFAEADNLGLQQLSAPTRNNSLVLHTRPLISTIWYFTDPLNCHQDEITWIIITCGPVTTQQVMMAHGEFGSIPRHQVRFVNWEDPPGNVPMHARCGDVVHVEWERPGGKGPHSVWRLFQRECPSGDDWSSQALELRSDYNLSGFHFEIPTNVRGRIYLTDGFNNFERCHETHLLTIIVSCRDLNKRDQFEGNQGPWAHGVFPLIELPVHQGWRFMPHTHRQSSNCNSRSGCRPQRESNPTPDMRRSVFYRDLPVTVIKAPPSPLDVPALPPEVAAQVSQEQVDMLPNGSMVQSVKLMNGTVQSTLINPPLPPLPFGVNETDVASREYSKGDQGSVEDYIKLNNGTVLYFKAFDITNPPRPAGLRDGDMSAHQIETFPNFTTIQTYFLFNATTMTFTIEPPPTRSPPDIPLTDVKRYDYIILPNNTFVQNFTLYNGTVWSIVRYPVTAPVDPLIDGEVAVSSIDDASSTLFRRDFFNFENGTAAVVNRLSNFDTYTTYLKPIIPPTPEVVNALLSTNVLTTQGTGNVVRLLSFSAGSMATLSTQPMVWVIGPDGESLPVVPSPPSVTPSAPAPSPGPAMVPEMAPGMAPAPAPGPSDSDEADRRRLQTQAPILFKQGPIPPVIVPPFPPEIQAQIVQTSTNALPNGSAVESNVFQNQTILSRVLDPPPPPLPLGVSESDVATRVYTRSFGGQSNDTIVLNNGTEIVIFNQGVTKPPLPLGLSRNSSDIASRTLTSYYNGTTEQVISLYNGTVYRWVIEYPIIDVPEGVDPTAVTRQVLYLGANNAFEHMLFLKNGTKVDVMQVPITPPYYTVGPARQDMVEDGVVFDTAREQLLRRNIWQNPNGTSTDLSVVSSGGAAFYRYCTEVVPVSPSLLSGLPDEVAITSTKVVVGPTGRTITTVELDSGSNIRLTSDPIITDFCPVPPTPAPAPAPVPDIAPSPELPPFPAPAQSPAPGPSPEPSPSPGGVVINVGSDDLLDEFSVEVPESGPIPGPPLPAGVNQSAVVSRTFSAFANGIMVETLSLDDGSNLTSTYNYTLDFNGGAPVIPDDEVASEYAWTLPNNITAVTQFLKNGTVVTSFEVENGVPISGGTVLVPDTEVTGVEGEGSAGSVIILEAPALAPLPFTVLGRPVVSQQTTTADNGSTIVTATLEGSATLTTVANPGEKVVTYINIPADNTTSTRSLMEQYEDEEQQEYEELAQSVALEVQARDGGRGSGGSVYRPKRQEGEGVAMEGQDGDGNRGSGKWMYRPMQGRDGEY